MGRRRGGGVVLVAVELLWGLLITGCQAVWLVLFLAGTFFSLVGCVCSQAVTQFCSFEMKLFCRALWRPPMDRIIQTNKQKAKSEKNKGEKEVSPCPAVPLTFSSEPSCTVGIVYFLLSSRDESLDL